MYIIIAGAGKVGWNLARELLGEGHEVTVIESDRERYLTVEEELEHEVPHHGLVHLLDLRQEQLEIIELEVAEGAPAAGAEIGDLSLPEGCLVVSVLRDGTGFVPKAETTIQAGDEVLAVLSPGDEPAVIE